MRMLINVQLLSFFLIEIGADNEENTTATIRLLEVLTNLPLQKIESRLLNSYIHYWQIPKAYLEQAGNCFRK